MMVVVACDVASVAVGDLPRRVTEYVPDREATTSRADRPLNLISCGCGAPCPVVREGDHQRVSTLGLRPRARQLATFARGLPSDAVDRLQIDLADPDQGHRVDLIEIRGSGNKESGKSR